MMVLVVALVVSLLVAAQSQASDQAASGNLKGFLSKYNEDLPGYSSGADASKVSHGNYNHLIAPSLNRMKHVNGPEALSYHSNMYELGHVDGTSASHAAGRPVIILDDTPFHTTAETVNLMLMLSTKDHG